MREIKFRAWDSRNTEMVYSDKEDSFYINTKGALFMYALPKSESGINTEYHKDYQVMQYTGLKDKNGVEIYDSDLLREEGDKIYIVKFSDEGYWMADPANCEGDWFHIYDFDWRVIGNIHENTELLTNDK